MTWAAVGQQIAGYRIEVAGDAPARGVWLSHDPTSRLPLSESQRRIVEERWQQRLESGRRVYDRLLYRLLGWDIHGSRLVLRTGLTSYKEFLGTNAGQSSSPLAISAVSITSDGRAIMNLRAPAVAEMAGMWHVTPAGHMHPPDSIASATWAELLEELDVKSNEVDGPIRATGLALNVTTGKPEVTLVLRLGLTAGEVLARKAVDSWEYTRLEPVEWSASSIADWLTANVQRCVPVGHAALLLAGRVDFGEEWYRGVVESLMA